MKLYTALVMDDTCDDSYNIGIYTSPNNAIKAFREYMEGIEIEKFDEFINPKTGTIIYYYRTNAHTSEEFEDHYTLIINGFVVDNMTW